MENLLKIGILILAYCVGSIPWGYILVKVFKGIDIREIESGRTGGTNAMRASGFSVGFITAMLDILKSASIVWIAKYLFPDSYWFHVMTALVTVISHNYSIYMIRRDQNGKITVGGGAGGTPALGSIVGLWWPSIFILVPAGYFIVIIIGYASLATLSLPLIWALRPNIKRLMNGTERIVGIRAKTKKQE